MAGNVLTFHFPTVPIPVLFDGMAFDTHRLYDAISVLLGTERWSL